MAVILTTAFFISIFLSGVYYVKYTRRTRKLRFAIQQKLNIIRRNIQDEIYSRREKEYFEELSSYIRTDFPKRVSTLKKTLQQEDELYVNLRQNLRLLDSFDEFITKLSSKKTKYRQTYKKSIEVVDLMNDKYSDSIVDKYLTFFHKDYNEYKEQDINDLDTMLQNAKKMYTTNSKELKDLFNDIEKKDAEILIKLEEPIRLRDKFIQAEDNIENLEDELKNVKGSIYYKVFNIIKNQEVSKEDTKEWNMIRKNIAGFKKQRLLKSDIIELNNILNNIVKDLSELSFRLQESETKSTSSIKVS